MPKFAVLVHGSNESEAGRMPTTQELTEMGAFNAQLQATGGLLDANGLFASSKGKRLTFTEGSAPTVKSGPFELENLVSGYWIVKFDAIEQVVEWAKKIPFKTGSVEIRQIAGPEDFGEAMTEELKLQEEDMQKKMEEQGGHAGEK